MKRTILSLLVGFSVTSQALADDLYQVYQQALQNDPTTLRAKATRDAAYSRIGQSKAALLPRISLSLSAGRSGGDISGSSNGADLNLSQSLYSFSNWASYDRAELVATQADATLGLAMQNLIVRTVNAYFAVLQAKDDLEFSEAEKRAISRQLEQTQQRFAVGLTAKTDVHEAQAQYDNAVASEISARNNVEIQLEVLREITGKYHASLDTLDTERFSTSDLSPQGVDTWLKMAEDKNLDLLSSKFLVDIAKMDIDLAQAGHYPELSLSANLSSDKSRGASERTNTNYVGVTLSVPIYSGGGTQAGVEVAQNNFIATSEQREQTYRSVVRSVRSSYYDVSATVSRIKALEQAVVSAESALNATEAGFEVGTRTIVDVLNSTRNLYDAKRNLSRARYNYITSVLSLKLASGSLTEQDLMSINQGLISMN